MADKTFIIRGFKSEDYDSVYDLWNRTGLGGVERGDTKTIIELSLELGGKLFVMEDYPDKKIIGTSWMTFDGRRFHLHHFGIDPLYQGKGYSKALLKESLEYAKKKNVQVKLEIHRKNIKAMNLYKKSGFKYLGDYLVFIIRDPDEINF